MRLFLEAALLVLAVSLVGVFGYDVVSTTNLVLFFLLAMVVAAHRRGVIAATLVALMSFAALDLVVIPPRFRFGSFDGQYFITFALFMLVAQVVSRLAERERSHGAEARDRERQTAVLYAFQRDIAAAQHEMDVKQALAHRQAQVKSLGPSSVVVAEALRHQAEVASEQLALSRETERARSYGETEKLQLAVLSSISHDLNTPLASLSASLEMLDDRTLVLDGETRASLLSLAREQTVRLRRVVSNVLDMTRVEAGTLRMNLREVSLVEVVAIAVEHSAEGLSAHRLEVANLETLPRLHVDAVLLAQALTNVLENAARYSPPGSTIWLRADLDGPFLNLSVLDEGKGIPESDLERVFQRFYRLPSNANVDGTGLGLAITRGIVECHGGRTSARARQPRGSEIRISLPLSEICIDCPEAVDPARNGAENWATGGESVTREP